MSELYQHRARKRFGQNFLHDAGVIHRILRAIHAREGQRLLEIGPGQGALTEGLLGSGARLDVIELDQDLIPLLKLKFGLESRFSLHQGDALKFDFASLVESGEKLRVVGNLPYNISTPLIFSSAGARAGDRGHALHAAKGSGGAPGGHAGRRRLGPALDHGPVSLSGGAPVQRRPRRVQPTAQGRLGHRPSHPFAEPPHPARDPKLLERVVREAFNQRRKTLRNTLKPLLSVEDIEAAEVDPTLRPEQLDLAAFVRLANRLAELPGNR